MVRDRFFNHDPVASLAASDPEIVNPLYTDSHRQEFASDPDSLRKHRSEIESVWHQQVRDMFFSKDDTYLQTVMERIRALTKKKLSAKPNVLKAFSPEFRLGCRRPTPAPLFYDVLMSDTTNVVRGEIRGVTPEGIIIDTHGTSHDLDALIFATGFDVDMMPPFQVRRLMAIQSSPD